MTPDVEELRKRADAELTRIESIEVKSAGYPTPADVAEFVQRWLAISDRYWGYARNLHNGIALVMPDEAIAAGVAAAKAGARKTCDLHLFSGRQNYD